MGRVLSAVAALALTSGAGCSLVLDFSERPDSGVDNPRCDAGEPNDLAASAPILAEGTNQLALCGDNDVDFFTLEVTGPADISLRTSSTESINLELALFSGATTIAVSDAPGSSETIERTEARGNLLEPGEYKIRVQSVPAGQQGDYDLVLETVVEMIDAGVDAS